MIQISNSALSQVSAWHALDHKPLLLPNISHGSTSWILIFENLPFQFFTDQTRLRLLKKVLILHAEKGLVRAGTPDLTLFHQVRSTNMHQIAKSPTCTKSTNHQITKHHKHHITFIPPAVLGCCLLFWGDGPVHFPHSPNHQVNLTQPTTAEGQQKTKCI